MRRGIGLQRVVGIRRGVAKVRWNRIRGNLRSIGADRRSVGAVQMKIVSQRREQAKWAYNGCRFRGQKGNSGLVIFILLCRDGHHMEQ
jgi:hypothetical protein